MLRFSPNTESPTMLPFSPFAFILPCLLFLFMLIKIFRAKSSSALKLPPGPKKLPLIGNLPQLRSPDLPHHHLNNLAKIYGPIYHLKVGELMLVVLTTPEIAEEVLKTQEINFAQKPPLFPSLETMFDPCSSFMYAPYGEQWRQLRKICVLELLSIKRVRSFQSIREDEMSYLVQFVRSSQGCPLNLTNKISSCLNGIISKAAFGESYKCQEYLSALKDGIELAGGLSVVDVFPSLRILRYFSRRKWKLDSVRRRCDQISNHILNDHKRQRENLSTQEDSFVKEDFVDVLLRIQESNELGFHLTDDHIKTIILEFYGGGTDTSSVTAEWAMSELLKNPQAMAKAQADVRMALKGTDRVQESDLEDLKYLKSVIKETLRLHPPVPLVPREARKACKIRGYDIPVKSRVLIHAGAFGRDPNHWEDPEKFVPERFLESSVDFIGKHYHFVPFGFGRRVCPGIAFAVANIELLLALLLYHFDWALPNGQTPEELDMTEAFAATVTRKSDLYAVATPHRHGHA